MRVALMTLLLAGTSAAADVEIHRCLMEDGTVAFQALPCPEPAVAADDGGEAKEDGGEAESAGAGDEASGFVNPFDEPAEPQAPLEPALPEALSGDRAACENTTREAIDAIDREIAAAGQQAQERLPELLELTKQLRACKQL